MANQIIRKAVLQDAGDIYDLECQYGLDVYSKSMIEKDILSDQTITLVICNDSIVVGYLSASFVIDECEILKIIVHNDFRKQGLGIKLINELIGFCCCNRIYKIFLEVRSSNIVAKNFYTKCGFERTGERKGYYNGEDAELYLLNINDESKL